MVVVGRSGDADDSGRDSRWGPSNIVARLRKTARGNRWEERRDGKQWNKR
jgi:hypothetical protein